MGRAMPTTTREILDRLAAVVKAQAERWPPSVRAQFLAFHSALVSRYRTGLMLKTGHKSTVAKWVGAVESRGVKAALNPPRITEAWWVPLKLCGGNCGREVSENSLACRSCHSKAFLVAGSKEERSERSRAAGLIRGAAMRARKEAAEEFAAARRALDARSRAVAEAEARLVPYRPPTQLILPFKPRRGRVGLAGCACPPGFR